MPDIPRLLPPADRQADDAVVPKLDCLLNPAVDYPGVEEFRKTQGPGGFGKGLEGFMEPAGSGAEGNEEGPAAPLPVEPNTDDIEGALRRLLYLTARQFQFREDEVYFLPVQRHGFSHGILPQFFSGFLP
jgi:hypothetical protein